MMCGRLLVLFSRLSIGAGKRDDNEKQDGISKHPHRPEHTAECEGQDAQLANNRIERTCPVNPLEGPDALIPLSTRAELSKDSLRGAPYVTGPWQDNEHGKRKSSVGVGLGRRSTIRDAKRDAVRRMRRAFRVCPGGEGCDCNSAMVRHTGTAAGGTCDLPECAMDTLTGGWRR